MAGSGLVSPARPSRAERGSAREGLAGETRSGSPDVSLGPQYQDSLVSTFL